MKRKGIGMAILFALGGCSDKTLQPTDIPTEYALLLAPASLIVQTRSGNIPLPSSTEIGLYAIDRENGTFDTGEHHRNVCYEVTDAAGSVSSTDPALLEKDHSYDIYAYAPLHTTDIEEKEDNVLFVVKHKEDLLYALPVPLKGATQNNCIVALQFEHRMSQVQFTLIPDQQLDLQYMKGAEFKISGFYENGYMNLRNGMLSPLPENRATIDNRKNLLQTDPVCVIPAESKQSLTITLKTDRKGSQTKTFDFQFEPGKSYQFTIKYTTSLDLEMIHSITTWKAIDGGNINIGGKEI